VAHFTAAHSTAETEEIAKTLSKDKS